MAQASLGDSEFDRDTAVTQRTPGTYAAVLSPGWSIIRALNGGYTLATAGRALSRALPHPDPFSITAHYLTPAAPGPAEIRTGTVRTGRTVSTGTAALVQYAQDGTEVERLRVLATYGDLDGLSDDVRTGAKPPAIAPREECFRSSDAPGDTFADSSLLQRLDVRMDPATCGWAVGKPSGTGEMRGWFGLADGRDPDPLSLLLAVDALPPAAFELGVTGWTPTVELTVHVRARPAPGPLRVSIATRNLAGGFLEEDAEVWDSADRLVAQSRQLARAPRPKDLAAAARPS
ncbi:thioesterase family protein [Streptomyces sp. NPDC047002]|uniref:thioesterase family protein n=1 Tax=Streptomyces sp. NPDC047002 TaxID=3155475 RepID=UPI00345721F3